MAEKYDPLPDLGRLLDAALRSGWSALPYVDRLMEGLGLGEDDSPETVAGALREALGIPGPRTVSFDMADKDAWLALDTALEDFSVSQRGRAGHERGNERRHEWADLADRMRAEATAARAAGWQEGPGGQ